MKKSDVRENNLRDMFFTFLFNWRVMAVCVALGIVFMLMLGYNQSKKDIETQNNAAPEESAESAEEQESVPLNENQKENLRSIYNEKAAYELNYTEQKEYNENSIKMQINSSAVQKVTIDYQLQLNDAQNVDRALEAWLSIYNNEIKCEELYNLINDALGENIGGAYYDEIITITTNKDMRDGITIDVIHFNKEDCLTIAKVIKDYIQTFRPTAANEEIGQCYARLISEQFSETVDAALLATQRSNASNLTSIRNSSNQLSAGLSAEEHKYLSALEAGTEETYGKNDAANESEESANLYDDTQKPEIKWSYGLGGIVVGIALAGLISCICYNSGRKIKFSNDMECFYQLPVLGRIQSKEQYPVNAIDRKVLSMYNGKALEDNNMENAVYMIALKLSRYLKEKERVNICIISSSSEIIGNIAVEGLKSRLHTIGVQTAVLSDIQNDPESLEKAIKSDGVILYEIVGAATHKNVKSIVDFCDELAIPIWGAVTEGVR